MCRLVPGPLVGIVVAAEVSHPVGIPCASGVRGRIVIAGQFAYPENRGNHIAFPHGTCEASRRAALQHKSCFGRDTERVHQARQGQSAFRQEFFMRVRRPLLQPRGSRPAGERKADAKDEDDGGVWKRAYHSEWHNRQSQVEIHIIEDFFIPPR